MKARKRTKWKRTKYVLAAFPNCELKSPTDNCHYMQRRFTSDRLHTHPSPNDNMSVEARASVSHKELIFLEMDRNRNTLKEYRSDKKPIKLYKPVKSSPVCRERAHKMRSA